jgi:hypothetical protein
MMRRAFFPFLLFLSLISTDAQAVFSVDTDLTSINFGTMKPNEVMGDIPAQGVTIRCTTDRGNAWTIRTHLEQPLTNSLNPSSIIPNENFRWYGISTTGSGTLVRTEQDYLVEKVIYSAPAGEGAGGVDVNVKFRISIPAGTESGTYTTRVILTMIE